MAPTDPFRPPTFPKLAVAFGIGVLLGSAVVLPAIQDGLAGSVQGDLGPVGSVLLIGVLTLVAVTLGLFSLYQLFCLVDR